MISQAVEYSLRAMVLLARSSGGYVSIQVLAAQGDIPAPYLSKLLHNLTRAKLVHSQRGQGGGFRLVRAPHEISLATVINAVEPLQRILTCPLGIAGHEKLCPLHRKLDEAMAAVEQTFRDTTLNDLLTAEATYAPLCSIESAGEPR